LSVNDTVNSRAAIDVGAVVGINWRNVKEKAKRMLSIVKASRMQYKK
jgi:hypothetical protein